MGNCLSRRSREENPAAPSSSTELPQEDNPAAPSSSTELPQELQECIDIFKEIQDIGDIDELINMIHQLLQRIKSKQQNVSTSSQPTQEIEQESGIWKSIIKKGSKFLEKLNKFGSSEKLHQGIKVVAETLPQVGQINSTVAGLSTIAFVLSKYEKMRDNQHDCLQTLGDLMDLARHLQRLETIIPEEKEKFTKAIQFIVEGSITCLRLLEDNKLFRFIKSSVNSEDLTNLRKRITELYPDLLLTSVIGLSENIPTYLPITKPISPVGAVGIENRVKEILDILGTTGQASLAVVIYGFGGLGKTTLADAVASNIDLKIYDYTRFEIYEESKKKDFKVSQQQILKDCFPEYEDGQTIQLRDCTEGKSHLMKAFRSKKGKPIFLYIDNALRADDLESLLPKELGELPHGSRILITTRDLAVTDAFVGQSNLVRTPYPLQPLPDEDAAKILFKDPTKAESIKKKDLDRILQNCSGVPLALKIVGGQLEKQDYQVDGCRNILDYLEKGEDIKKEGLTERLFNFAYGKLDEYSREALLDICCFFNKWNRLEVECIVGADAVTSLLEVGLITSNPEYDDPNVSPQWKELVVHDIIRAKGRNLAKDTRIFSIESLGEAEKHQRLDRVKGVWLESKCTIEERHLNLMTKSLRILSLGENIRVSRVSQMRFEMRFEELKFLRVLGKIPQLSLQFEKLDKLGVFYWPFFTEGEVNLCKLPKSLLSMLVMNQRPSRNSRMTGVPPYLSLKKLDFRGFAELPKLPEGFNQLVALEVLILDYTDEMEELPEQVCQLPALKILSMRGWCKLKCLPESFGRLTSLTYLDLEDCIILESLPQTFEHLTALRDLNIDGCVQLKSLPTGFRQLTSLQHVECCQELESSVQKEIGSQAKVIINDGFFSKLPKRWTTDRWVFRLRALP